MSETIRLKIRRQDGPDTTPRWEKFEVSRSRYTNVITCLQEIQKKPGGDRQACGICRRSSYRYPSRKIIPLMLKFQQTYGDQALIGPPTAQSGREISGPSGRG